VICLMKDSNYPEFFFATLFYLRKKYGGLKDLWLVRMVADATRFF